MDNDAVVEYELEVQPVTTTLSENTLLAHDC